MNRPKKKAQAKAQAKPQFKEKMTIIKVLGVDDAGPTMADLEKWRSIFAEKRMTVEEAQATGEVAIEHFVHPDDENYITFVKIGNEDYQPTFEDLEAWRKCLEEAKDDPDFKIFTHPGVEIFSVAVGKVIAVD